MKVVFRCPPELDGLLPRPLPAKLGLPAWFKTVPMHVFDDDLAMDVMTVKKCPPFVDAMTAGFLMPLPCDIRVREGRFDWDWDLPPTRTGRHSRSPITLHTPSQATGTPLFDADTVLVKFNAFWTVTLEPGWSLLCTHPLNRTELPFTSLTGLVDADRYGDNFINFVARWTDPSFEGLLAKGTPIAQCIPVCRDALELEFEMLEGDAADRFAAVRDDVAAGPGAYRRRHRVRK